MNKEIKFQILPIGVLIVLAALFFYNDDLIGPFIFLIVGGAFIYSGFHFRNSSIRVQTKGIRTKAKITGFVEEKIEDADGDSNTYYFPIVKFTDRNGIETTQKLDSSENPKKINELIEIIYLKKGDEYEIIRNSEFWKSYFHLTFIIGGLLFSGLGLLWMINKI